MKRNTNLITQLDSIKGKTIAIVYIFENEDAAGFQHYWVWKSDIISGWLNAVQEIGCLPFILDVRTFVQKAINRDLPHIDYVINLNCGNYDLSTMSLVPSVCSFLAIPCIPCNAGSIVMSENKSISNMIARAQNMKVPKDLDRKKDNGIYRPLNLGSSIGVKIGRCEKESLPGTYQEFVPGYDITIPLVYNPGIANIDLLPPIIYIPHSLDPNWIYDESEKINDDGFTTYAIGKISNDTKKQIIDLAHAFPITTFGRVDVRLKTSATKLTRSIIDEPLTSENLYFIEINSMPTIEREDSFEFAIEAAKTNRAHSLKDYVNTYYNLISSPTVNGFLLASSILSFIAMC